MKNILRYSKGLIYLYFTAYSLIVFELTISICLILRGRETCDTLINTLTVQLARLYRLIYRVLHGTRVIIDTSIQLPSHQSHLVLSSHKGASDFFVLPLLLPTPPRFIAKQELGKAFPIVNIPTISKILTVQNHALIDRNNTLDSLKKIKYFCHLQTVRKNNILLFPEGTRHKATATKPFFSSSIKLILKTRNIPIVLVALSNGHKIDSFFNVPPNITLRAKIMGIHTLENFHTLEKDIEQFRNTIDTQLLEWEKEDNEANKTS